MSAADYERHQTAALDQLGQVQQGVASKGLSPLISDSIAYAQVHATLALAAAIASLGAASTTTNPPPGEQGEQQ